MSTSSPFAPLKAAFMPDHEHLSSSAQRLLTGAGGLSFAPLLGAHLPRFMQSRELPSPGWHLRWARAAPFANLLVFWPAKRRATKLASNACGRPHAIFACWWQRPQTPLNTEFHSVATRSSNVIVQLSLNIISFFFTTVVVSKNAVNIGFRRK